jgi:class 3 adenylate cyclase/tetratricopeptide (TPR) repeat protein
LVALNADIVGYSKLLADDFEATTAAMEEYHLLVEEKIVESGGTLANFVGDNFMGIFDDAAAAMRASIAISAAIETKNLDIPSSRQVRFRMGIDQGEVSISGDNYFGDALNIAARIQAMAIPGGVSVSGRVYRSLDEPELRFKSMGRKDLKNIPEEVEVYQFADLPAEGPSPSGGRTLALEAPTIAVLPIHPERVDPSIAPAAEMLRADLIYRLANMPNLNVIDSAVDGGTSNTSARYLLETGIHQFGDQVRIYASVLEVSTLSPVTSDRWTSTSTDLLEISDQIADDVARSLEIELIIGEPARTYNELGDPEAIKKIYQGWYRLTSGTLEGWAGAVELFEEVAISHPDEPYGHVLAAFANWMGAAQGMVKDRDAYLERAFDQAQTAAAMDEGTGLATTVIAAILMSQGNAVEALEKVESVEIQRPTCDVTFAVEGSVRRYLGDWEKSVDLLDKAMRLSSVNKPWYPTVQACSLYIGGRVEQAASTAEAVIEYQPNNLEALLVLAASQVALGLDRRAHATAELIKERYPAVDVEKWLADNPYQDVATVDRWKEDLTAAGVLDDAS